MSELKKAAEDLLKVAEDIEKEAAEVTQFVCVGCNHTATLATINTKRADTAKEAGEHITVAEININEKVACPACGGEMSYKPTEASEKFYYDNEKDASKCEDKEEEKEEEEKKEASEPIDYDSLERYSS